MNNSSKTKSLAMKNQSGAEQFPERIRLIIFRKLQDIKSRKNKNGDNSLVGGDKGEGGKKREDVAEKRLLKEYDVDGHLCEPVMVEEVSISKENKCNNNKEQEKVVESSGGLEKNKDVIKVKTEIDKSMTLQKVEKKIDDEKEEEEEDANEIGRSIGLGSPSFRIYCVEPVKKKEEHKCNDLKGDEKQIVPYEYKKTASDVSVESLDSASRKSNEEVTLKPVELKPNAESGVGMELTSTKNKTLRKKKMMLIKINMLNISLKNRINPMFSCTGGTQHRQE